MRIHTSKGVQRAVLADETMTRMPPTRRNVMNASIPTAVMASMP
jgi:hypothetical protein